MFESNDLDIILRNVLVSEVSVHYNAATLPCRNLSSTDLLMKRHDLEMICDATEHILPLRQLQTSPRDCSGGL